MCVDTVIGMSNYTVQRFYVEIKTYPVKSVFTWRHGGHIGVPNNETAAMLVSQTNPVGVELLS